jgi:hypothetical protein
MMRIVDLAEEVGDRELELMRPQRSGRVARREAEPAAEEQQDVRRLADDPASGAQERRRERRTRERFARKDRLDRGRAAALRLGTSATST